MCPRGEGCSTLSRGKCHSGCQTLALFMTKILCLTYPSYKLMCVCVGGGGEEGVGSGIGLLRNCIFVISK